MRADPGPVVGAPDGKAVVGARIEFERGVVARVRVDVSLLLAGGGFKPGHTELREASLPTGAARSTLVLRTHTDGSVVPTLAGFFAAA